MKGLRFLRTRLAASRQLQAVGGTTLALFAAQGMMAVAGVFAARELGPAGLVQTASVLPCEKSCELALRDATRGLSRNESAQRIDASPKILRARKSSYSGPLHMS
jgi:hypothetical protein